MGSATLLSISLQSSSIAACKLHKSHSKRHHSHSSLASLGPAGTHRSQPRPLTFILLHCNHTGRLAMMDASIDRSICLGNLGVSISLSLALSLFLGNHLGNSPLYNSNTSTGGVSIANKSVDSSFIICTCHACIGSYPFYIPRGNYIQALSRDEIEHPVQIRQFSSLQQ